MGKPVFNIADAVFTRELKHGERFEARLAPISSQLGTKMLSYNLTEVAPGKRAFPFHNHHSNEEFFFMVEGEGTLRFGDDEYPVGRGDVIACPPGGPEVAHQLINTGSTPLRYLALSTTVGTDVFQYPDSGKSVWWPGASRAGGPGMHPSAASLPRTERSTTGMGSESRGTLAQSLITSPMEMLLTDSPSSSRNSIFGWPELSTSILSRTRPSGS